MLSKIIVSLGDIFPMEKDMHFATTYAQSAMLVANLLANIDPTKRLALAKTLLKESQSLEYALEIYQWIFYGEESVLASEKISENQDIKRFLINRYQGEMTKANFFKLIRDADLAKILLWWSKMESEKSKLEALLNDKLSSGTNPDFALRLIKVFTPTKNSFSLKPQSEKVENIVFKAGFNLAHFKLLEEIVDPFLIERNLTQNQKLNLSPKNPSNLSEREAWDDKTLISVFQWYLHHNES